MGKNNKNNKNDQKIARQPDINNIGKLVSTEKLINELKSRVDRLNGDIISQDQLKKLTKMINIDSNSTKDSKLDHQNNMNKNSAQLVDYKIDQPNSESQSPDDTMEGIDSESYSEKLDKNLQSFIENPLKKNKPMNRIPAIKFTIAFDQCDKFKNQCELSKEILRCHQTVDKKLIKFASIKSNLIIIATDDQDTYKLLSSNWPTDAFIKGIRQIKKEHSQNKGKSIIIKNVHTDIDLNDEEVKSQLAEQGLINVTRIMSSKTKAPTSLLKAETTTESSYRAALLNKVKIGFVKCPTEPLKTIIQCYKCQKTGHAHFNCPNTTVCPKCSGAHSLKECQQESQIKCSNCGGDHYACSRRCPFLKQASVEKIKQLQNKNVTSKTNLCAQTTKSRTYAQITKGEVRPTCVPSNQTSNLNPTAQLDSFLQKKVLTNIEATIESFIEKAIEKIILEKLPTLIEAAIAKLGQNNSIQSSLAKETGSRLSADSTPTRVNQRLCSNPPTPKYVPTKSCGNEQIRSARNNE